MKFTLSWLKDHLETEASIDRLAEALTALGLEVEEVGDAGRALAPFVVARVLTAERHPNADKLQVCTVDIGKGEPVQVVCGAPNARAGMTGVFAPVGSVIPATGKVLEAGVIRGVASNGMLCSEREMGLSDEHTGIIELPGEPPLGSPFAKLLGLDDPVIDISLTPDRADCAGVRGVARDLAAAGLGRLKPLAANPVPGLFDTPVSVALDLPADAANACPMFAARLIRGVANGESPKWLQDRLKAIGLRPISALVDITNYVTMDLARPLHVFDAGKLRGNLTVRLARPGEQLSALNGKEYTLDDTMTVIADGAGVQSLGGIVGGTGTGCDEATVDVLIECALFDPVRTAATGRKLGVESDARYRFERGVDPSAVVDGIEIATRLVLDLCGGTPGTVRVSGHEPDWRRTLRLRPSRVAALGGVAVPAGDQLAILTALGCNVEPVAEDGEALLVSPPGWRGDIEGEADLVEEVLRVRGFDTIPAVPLDRTAPVTRPALSIRQRRASDVRRALAARGLMEAVTWSFLPAATARLFGGGSAELTLVNPISTDLDTMRPSVLANLVQAAGRNADRGYPDVGLFELGPAYRTAAEDGQDLVAGGVRAGDAVPRHWAVGRRPVDLYDAKADAMAALDAAGAPTGNLQVTTDAPEIYHPGRSGCLRLGPSVLARFGELHPGVLDALGVRGPMVAFELFLDRVPLPKRKPQTTRPPVAMAAFQPIVRDFAFVVDRTIEADKLARAARGADKPLVVDVAVFDVYQGPGVAENAKSVALTVTLQPTERTLTDAEIEAVAGRVVAAVTKATGATLRS